MVGILVCLYLISWPLILSVTSSNVRLENGNGLPNQGRLEIYDNILGVWGTICDNSFDTNAAGVVCQQLGYTRFDAQVKTQAYFGRGSGRIAYDDVRCSGTETDLSQCQHSSTTDCTHANDVGIICHNTSTGDCDFEQRCQWSGDQNNNFNWTIHSGPTSTAGTGPSSDHTTGTSAGHYAYMESSMPRRPGDTARLASPSLSDSRCLHFWYHMLGSSLGTLNVVVSSSTGNSTVWSRSGNQGDVWHQAVVTVTSTQAYHVVMEGIRGSSYRGDIAIDDISFTQSSCSMQNGTDKPTSPATSKNPTIMSSHLTSPTTQMMVTSSQKVTNHATQYLACSTCDDYLTFRCQSFATECDNTCMVRYKDGRLQTKCALDQECRDAQQDDFLNVHSSTRCCRSDPCISDSVQQVIRVSQNISSSTPQPRSMLLQKAMPQQSAFRYKKSKTGTQ